MSRDVGFRWPGPDVLVLDDGTPVYGAIPDWLVLAVWDAVTRQTE